METARKFRLEKELARNNKRIADCLKEAEILEARNVDLNKELNGGRTNQLNAHAGGKPERANSGTPPRVPGVSSAQKRRNRNRGSGGSAGSNGGSAQR